MRNHSRQHRTPERGQVLVMFVLTIPLIFGVLGLAVDLGWCYYRQQMALAAAQSAALAGAAAAGQLSGGTITCGSNNVVCQAVTQCPKPIPNPTTNNVQTACAYAQDNGFVVTTGGPQNVTVASGTGAPPTVAGLTVPYWVTVRVSENIPQTFAAVLGNTLATVSARATAGYFSNSGGCIYVMKATSTAVTMSGTPVVQTACGIYVNSSSSSAVLLSGTPQITVTGGDTLNIVGNILKSGSPVISPTPKTGVAATADPFISMTAPAVGACTSNGVTLSGGSQTLNPGVYCGAITISGTVALTLNPGLYVLKAGITMSGGTSITGAGVMLYLPTGGLTMSGTGGITLSAPTSGIYKGITIYQDRSNSSSDTLSGGAAQNINGVVYMPAGDLTFSGGGAVGGTTTTLVVNAITFSGNSSIKSAATTAFTGGSTGAILIE